MILGILNTPCGKEVARLRFPNSMDMLNRTHRLFVSARKMERFAKRTTTISIPAMINLMIAHAIRKPELESVVLCYFVY